MRDIDLQKFCSEILMALDSKVIPYWFNDGFTLCTNAWRYDQVHGTFVYDTLSDIFEGESYPFNDCDSSNYHHERWHGGFYENKKRMDFLKKHAKGA